MRMGPVLQWMRALMMALAAALALLGPGAPVAHAWDEWCDTDPILVVITPQGAKVPVFYLTGVYGERNVVAGLLGNLSASYTVQPAGSGTRVEVRVTVPDRVPGAESDFPTRVKVSEGPLGTLKVYGTAQGTSGEPMTVTFTLPVP
jgi:hypothetical protein